MARGYHGHAVLVECDVASTDIAVAAEYELALGVPYYQLTARFGHGVVAVDVTFEACTAARGTESNLAETSDFAHGIGGVVRRHNVYLVVTFVGRTQKALFCEFLLYQCRFYRLYYRFVHFWSTLLFSFSS